MIKNLREAIERFLSHTPLADGSGGQTSLPFSPRQKRTSGERARSQETRQRRLALYRASLTTSISREEPFWELPDNSIWAIAGYATRVRSPQFPEWGKPAKTKSALDPYRSYLQERWHQGCRETGPLWQELQARGFTGSRMMVYRWVQLQTDEPTLTAQNTRRQSNRTEKSMAPRHLAWLFLRDAEQLNQQEKQTLSLIRQTPAVELVYTLAQQLVSMVKQRNAQPLSDWFRDCQSSGVSDLMTFAQGLETERSALHGALTLPYSTGPVEGKITKLKYIKRSMYGRCAFPLLRQKVLKAA